MRDCFFLLNSRKSISLMAHFFSLSFLVKFIFFFPFFNLSENLHFSKKFLFVWIHDCPLGRFWKLFFTRTLRWKMLFVQVQRKREGQRNVLQCKCSARSTILIEDRRSSGAQKSSAGLPLLISFLFILRPDVKGCTYTPYVPPFPSHLLAYLILLALFRFTLLLPRNLTNRYSSTAIPPTMILKIPLSRRVKGPFSEGHRGRTHDMYLLPRGTVFTK